MSLLNSCMVIAIMYLLLQIDSSQSSTDSLVKRNLLSEGLITASNPSDSLCCDVSAANCSDEIIPSCAVDGNPMTTWTLKNGTMRAHISIQLNASSLVSDISVMLSQSSVIPSSIVVTASGTNITWTTYFNDTCQPNDEYLRRRDSLYYSCRRSTGQMNLTVSVPEGLFSVRNASSDGWLWWRIFNQFNLTIEANAGDYTNANTSGSIEIEDVQLFGWDEPMTTSCNCHPVGLADVEKPCSTDGRCICRTTSTSNSQCIPNTNIAVPYYGPVSGGTVFVATGNYLVNATNLTLGENIDCSVFAVNDTLLRVQTSAGSESDLRSAIIPVRIFWERPQGVVSSIVANWEFTFKPDPIIHSIFPLVSIVRGGIPLTVTGENLDSVALPYITIVLEIAGQATYFANWADQNSVLQQGDEFCHHINSTRLICITPGTEHYVSYISYPVTKTTLTIWMDIKKYNDHTKCEFTDKNCSFVRTVNPDVTEWSKTMVYNAYNEKKAFRVEGRDLDTGNRDEDVKLTVDGVQCEIIDVVNNLISFYPPDPSNFTSVKNSKTTIMSVGYYSFTVGKIQYYLSWIDNPTNRNGLIIGLVCGVGGAVIIILAIILYRTYYRSKPKPPAPSPFVQYNLQGSRYTCAPQRDPTLMECLSEEQRSKVEKFLIEPSRIHLEEEIGSGNFGQVHRGLFFKTDDDIESVAIKTIRKSPIVDLHDKVSFIEEATIMTDFSHPNVLSLIAVYIEDDFPYVVLPLMENGDLREFVSTPDKLLSVLDLTSYSLQVAEGMAYLAENKFIHRDLAARNCMMNKDFVVKVADFGLARDIFENDYYRTKEGNRPLPVKWMAIECLAGEAKFTESSDVWSFGVLMWELFTRGRRPYADIDNLEIKRFLLRGERLEKNRNTPDFIYNLMWSCWKETPTDRPRFKELVNILQGIVGHATENSRASMTSMEYVDETVDANQIELHVRRERPVSYLDLMKNVPSAYFEQKQGDSEADLKHSSYVTDNDQRLTRDNEGFIHEPKQDYAGSSSTDSRYVPSSFQHQKQDSVGSIQMPKQEHAGSSSTDSRYVPRSIQHLKQDDAGSISKHTRYVPDPTNQLKQDDVDSIKQLRQDHPGSKDSRYVLGSFQQPTQDDVSSIQKLKLDVPVTTYLDENRHSAFPDY